MPRFIESIKLLNGKFYRLELHQNRINKVFDDHFKKDKKICLNEYIYASPFPKKGLYKCRIVFDSAIRKLEYIPYEVRKIRSLRLLETDIETLPYKKEDRSNLNNAFAKREHCDDVLLIKNGLLTDTSFCNIAFFDGHTWITPRIPLIYGVNRAQLLAEGKIIEKDIKIDELANFSSLRLFNAMIEFDECELTPYVIRKYTHQVSIHIV